MSIQNWTDLAQNIGIICLAAAYFIHAGRTHR